MENLEFRPESIPSLNLELLIQNNSLLKLILQNQIENISEKTGEPLEEIVKLMSERLQSFRTDEFLKLHSKFGL